MWVSSTLLRVVGNNWETPSSLFFSVSVFWTSCSS